MVQQDELEKLDEDKYLVKRIIRKYINSGSNEPRPKNRLSQQSVTKRKSKRLQLKLIIIFLLFLLIVLLFFKLIAQKKPELVFLNEINNEYISGDVYLDGILLGHTDGSSFKDVPKNYCLSSHKVSLVSDKGTFSWPSTPTDCLYNRITFYMNYTLSSKTKNILIKFSDADGVSINGRLFVNGIFLKDVDGEISFSEEECNKIQNILLDFGQESLKNISFDNNVCTTNSEIEFKIH